MPAFPAGNADVDIEMLGCSEFSMLIMHDDVEYEFAYTKAAERSVVSAREKGWTLVSMRKRLKHCVPMTPVQAGFASPAIDIFNSLGCQYSP
jgi:hypothetical protein